MGALKLFESAQKPDAPSTPKGSNGNGKNGRYLDSKIEKLRERVRKLEMAKAEEDGRTAGRKTGWIIAFRVLSALGIITAITMSVLAYLKD